MPMRPIRNSQMNGVIGNGDVEMSSIDVNQLRPESVSAAVLDGAVHGAFAGASMTAWPIGLGAMVWASVNSAKEDFLGNFKLNSKPVWIGASIVAGTALIMGAMRAFTAGQQAQVHNAWSAKVLDHMQQRQAVEAARQPLTVPAATFAEQAQLPTATHSEQAQADKQAAAEAPQRG